MPIYAPYTFVDFPSTSTPITAARLNTAQTDLRDLAKSGSVVRLSHYTNTTFGDGATSFDTAFTNAIAALQAGGMLLVDIPGVLLVSSTIKLPQLCTIQGMSRYGTQIKAANASNLHAVIASDAWIDNDASFNQFQTIRSLSIDCNGSNQSSGDGHGIALWCYEAKVEDVLIYGGRGDCVRHSSANRAGTENGTASECYILNSEFRFPTGAGVRSYDPDPTVDSNQADGYIINCQFESVGTYGIQIDHSAGWTIRGNHLYGLPISGIRCDYVYETSIVDNYIESWGTGTVVGATTAAGIDCTSFAIGGVVIANNRLNLIDALTDADFYPRGIYVRSGASVTAEASITGNKLHGVTNANTSVGILCETQNNTSTLYAELAGNQIRGFDTSISTVDNTGNLGVKGRDDYRTISTNAAVTLYNHEAPNVRHTGTLTANRAVTLSTAGARSGQKINITRTGTGAFTLDVGTGPLKSLSTNQWCEVTFDGSAWYLSRYGAL